MSFLNSSYHDADFSRAFCNLLILLEPTLGDQETGIANLIGRAYGAVMDGHTTFNTLIATYRTTVGRPLPVVVEEFAFFHFKVFAGICTLGDKGELSALLEKLLDELFKRRLRLDARTHRDYVYSTMLLMHGEGGSDVAIRALESKEFKREAQELRSLRGRLASV